jgi:uncharacterized protein
MKFSQELGTAKYNITAHEPDRIRINDEWQTDSFILTPAEIIQPWHIDSINQLTEEHCQQLADLKPEVLIIGTGQRQQFPDMSVLRAFAQGNIGVEFMDTAAACRTFNILTGEDRSVVAGLIIETGEN